MRILVIGNYTADRQQSMSCFSDLLVRIYSPYSYVKLIRPPVLVTRLPGLSAQVCKYLAYIDKLIIFPIILLFRCSSYDLIHIADHSNSFYVFCFPFRRCLVTCHDMLAVRAAYGDPTVVCPTSRFGIWFQRLISAGLRRCSAVAFDSHATFVDYKQLIGLPPSQRHRVIPIPLNAPFTADHSTLLLSVAEKNLLPPRPYLLMVGSAQPRKNRALALKLIEYLGESTSYSIVFAGAPLEPSELAFQSGNPLGSKLFSIPSPSHVLLNLLYCQAHALLFPSFAEGFGWPLVEAQICQCPVIASLTTSIPEVAGEGALYAKATDVASFAAHVRALEDPIIREDLIQLGLTNMLRYDAEQIGETYRRFAFQL
jgi:glycosyltransferase involved in cell wall biosynthesis